MNETETSAWESEREWESEEESKSRANEFLASVCVFLFFSHARFLLFCKSGIKKEKNSLNFFLELTFWVFNSKAWRLNFENLEGQQDVKKVQSCFSCKKKVYRQQRCKNIFHQVCQNFCCILMNFEKSWLDEKKKKKKIRIFGWKKIVVPDLKTFLNLFRRNWTILNFFSSKPESLQWCFLVLVFCSKKWNKKVFDQKNR